MTRLSLFARFGADEGWTVEERLEWALDFIENEGLERNLNEFIARETAMERLDNDSNRNE